MNTGRMDTTDGGHLLASWIRQPEICAASVAAIGVGFLVASLMLPVGVANLGLSAIGATCLVSGVVTLLLHVVGRLLGLHRRSQRAVLEGREGIVFPGPRPRPMFVRPRDPSPPATTPAAPDAPAVQTDAGTSADPEPEPVVDLTHPTVPTQPIMVDVRGGQASVRS